MAPIARVPSAGPLGAKTTPPAHQRTAANEGCIWAPAALGAPAKESRHRVTVCPSARPSCPSLQSSPSPRPAGTPGRRLDLGNQESDQGDET